ncbi:MAG: cyclase family protein [Candidatus Rokubacteria bacterium]|nr:cyclase family protein [Candidatus Rokubacteria bacterium]
MGWTKPSEADVARYFERLNNWGRWGQDDQKGTLNLVTADKRAAAVALARTGRTVSLARDLTAQPALDHHMLLPLEWGKNSVALDYFGLIFHGVTITHVDALCHVDYDGKVYNGVPFKDSIKHGGAKWGAIDPTFDGIVTRGVLIDVASLRPEGYVTAGNPVTPPDLDAAAERARVRVEPGDVVVVRSGRETYEQKAGNVWAPPAGVPAPGTRPGLHISCLEWLREKDVAAIAWDMMDERPVGYGDLHFGVHLGIPILGLTLIDNTYPERLVAACREENRSEFLFTALPLRLAGATGSPVNPVAIF